MAEFGFSERYREFIRLNVPGSKPGSGNKEMICRCKYCPDSRDYTHGHMYVHIPQNSKDASTFYCMKCHTSGAVDSRRLKEWGIYDPEIGSILDDILLKGETNNVRSNKGTLLRQVYNLRPYVQDEVLAQMKIDYLNDRLGTKFDMIDCRRLKIIPNLEETLLANNITQYTRDLRIIGELNRYFIGFLSMDNNFVNLRRIVKEGRVNKSIDKRYINYNIHNKFDNTEKMYSISDIVDLTSPYRVQVHLAEGPMDILSIKYNVRNCEPGIYVAVTGSGYKGFISMMIRIFKIYYFDLHIYPDNDPQGTDDVIYDIASMVEPLGIRVYVHRNMKSGEKDFGVTPDRISEVVYTADSLRHYF